MYTNATELPNGAGRQNVNDVACFVRPGEVACIWMDDVNNPYYDACQAAYKTLSETPDTKGPKLKVHKLCMPKKDVSISDDFAIDSVEGTQPREDGDVVVASYINFLVVNGGVIVPQFGDENDALALKQIQAMFPERKAVGGQTIEGSITQKVPTRPRPVRNSDGVFDVGGGMDYGILQSKVIWRWEGAGPRPLGERKETGKRRHGITGIAAHFPDDTSALWKI